MVLEAVIAEGSEGFTKRDGVGVGKLSKEHLRQDILCQTYPTHPVPEIHVSTRHRVLCAKDSKASIKYVHSLCVHT